MARIRSIHPSLFTDEAWVSRSPLARVLYIGLLTDADDQGLFEWKPLQIRMRLLAGDNADVSALLAELAEADLIAPLDSAGKKLGAIRRFCKFQRPKKPNRVFVLPSEWGTYVGSTGDGSEPDDDEAATSTELKPVKPPAVPKKSERAEQMEEGGGSKSSVPDGTGGSAPSDGLRRFSALDPSAKAWASLKYVLSELGGVTSAKAGVLIGKWKRDHKLTDIELVELATVTWKAQTRDPVPYMAKAAMEIVGRRGLPGIVDAPTERQRAWMREFVEKPNNWRHGDRGPRPGHDGCRVAPEIQREFGVEPANPRSPQ